MGPLRATHSAGRPHISSSAPTSVQIMAPAGTRLLFTLVIVAVTERMRGLRVDGRGGEPLTVNLALTSTTPSGPISLCWVVAVDTALPNVDEGAIQPGTRSPAKPATVVHLVLSAIENRSGALLVLYDGALHQPVA